MHVLLKVQHGPQQFLPKAKIFFFHVFLVTAMERDLSKLSQMYIPRDVANLVICCQQDWMFEYKFVNGHLDCCCWELLESWQLTTVSVGTG